MAREVLRLPSNRARPVALIGALAGVGVIVAGPSPTGAGVIDSILILGATTLVVWCGATAPWWALIVMSGTASLLAVPHWTMGVGAVLFLASIAVGARQKAQPIERVVIVGGSLTVLASVGSTVFFGLSSLAGVTLAVAVAAMGIWRRPNTDRRIVAWIVVVAAAYSLVAVASLAITAATIRSDLRQGNQAAHNGFAFLKQGEFDAAKSSFAEATQRFAVADDALAKPWAQLTRLVPIANQYRNAADELSGAAAEATRVTEVQLRRIDFDTLKVSNGQIDLDSVRALEEPMRSLQTALEELDGAVTMSRSPWLVDRLRVKVDDLSDEISKQRDLGAKALRALEQAPAMLGADGKRLYFVMFTTPAEARGQGGFMGNYAELTIDDGHIEMTAFGRTSNLAIAASEDIAINGPQDWLARYGPYGFQSGPDRTFDPIAWSNITVSPNFPSTAQVIADIYPQSGGQEIDGVINLDVFALQELVGFVGPLDIQGAPAPLTGENTAEFLLLGQYLNTDGAARVDMLQRVAEQTMVKLLSTAPPNPIEIGQAFAPLVQQRRAMIWAKDPVEQAMLADANLDAALLQDLENSDGIAVAVNNGSANKIDSFLERDYTYDVVVDQLGRLTGTLTLTLTNSAPPDGYPDYVISNLIGRPNGTSRLLLTVFTPSDAVSVTTKDGRPVAVQVGQEAGVSTYSHVIDIASGESTTIVYTLTNTVPPGPYELVVDHQPLSIPEKWRLNVDDQR